MSVDLTIIENMMDNIQLGRLVDEQVLFLEGFSLLQRASKAKNGKWTIVNGTDSNLRESSTEISESDLFKAAGYDSANSFEWTTYTVGKSTSKQDQSLSAGDLKDEATSSLAL